MPPEQNLTAGRTLNDYFTNQVEPSPQPQGDIPMRNPESIQENHIRTISIRQLNHGYMVEVGCQTVAIESATKLVSLLSAYIFNPIEIEQKYREGKLI